MYVWEGGLLETTREQDCDVDRRMLRNRRNVPKQLDAVLDTWIRMDTSESDSPAVGLPHLPKVSRVISVPVPKCLQAEVSWGRSVRKAQ